VIPEKAWLKSGTKLKLLTSTKYCSWKADRNETVAAAGLSAQVAAKAVLGTIHVRVSQEPRYRLKALLNSLEKSHTSIVRRIPVPRNWYQTLGPRSTWLLHLCPLVAFTVFHAVLLPKNNLSALSHLSFCGRIVSGSIDGILDGGVVG
jgi:hypothetical protein